MIELHTVAITNVVSFKEALLSIEEAPLTFVYGENRDAESEEGLPGNGAGKSLLFATIPNVRFQAPPTAKAKKAKKDLLYKKGSCIELDFHNGDCSYNVQQMANKFSILKDDVDQQVTTVPKAEQYLEEIWPINDTEFYTHGYISTARKFPMQSDTDSVRLEHLTSIFRLDFFSKLRAHFAKKQRQIKDDEIRLQVLEQNKLTLAQKIKKSKVGWDKESIGAVSEQRKILQDQDHRITDILFGLNKQVADYESLLTIERELDQLRGKYRSKTAPDKYQKQLKVEREAAQAWNTYAVEMLAYNRAVLKIDTKLEALGKVEGSQAALETERDGLTKTLKRIETKLDDLKKLKADADKLDRRIKTLRGKVGDVDMSRDVTSDIESCRVTLKLEALLKHDCDDGKCPTCLSDVDLNSIKRAVAHAKKKLPALEHVAEQQRLNTELRQLVTERKALKYSEDAVNRLAVDFDHITARLDSIHTSLSNLKEYSRLRKERSQIEYQEKPNVDKPELSLDEINAELDLCSDILGHIEAKQSLLGRSDIVDIRSATEIKARLSELKKTIGRTETEQRKYQTQLSRVMTKLDWYKSKKAELDLYKKEWLEAEAELKELAPTVEHKQVVDSLLKAYSSKGLKTKVADQICTLLETNLNHYRELIFAEPFEFTVESNETGVSITVDRGNGHVSDVRFLSAAESNCFTCLFLLSILPLIPDSRRLNFVVLDEPMCHAHEVTRAIFRERFLPVLCEVVPHVFVVTQFEDDFIEGARKLYVVKENGISYLEEETVNS